MGSHLHALPGVLAERRIGGSYAALFYAGGTPMDLPGFLTGISFAANAYKAAVELRDEAQITAATHELQAQLVIAGAHCLDMNAKVLAATDGERAALARVHELEDAVAELKRQARERDRYELVEDYPGTFALRVKEDARGTEPLHYICPGCMDNKAVKSILQFSGKQKRFATCPACTTTYRFEDDPPLKYRGPF